MVFKGIKQWIGRRRDIRRENAFVKDMEECKSRSVREQRGQARLSVDSNEKMKKALDGWLGSALRRLAAKEQFSRSAPPNDERIH